MTDEDEDPHPAEERPAPGRISELEPKSQELSLKRRPFWPFAAVVLGVLVTIGGIVFYIRSRPDPFKVLVAIDVGGQAWEGSKPAAALADRISDALRGIGFEPVRGGDPEVEKVLASTKSPEEAARRLGAGFVITGSLSPEILEHPIDGVTLFEARSNATLRVSFVGDRENRGQEVSVFGLGHGRSKDEALAALADAVAPSVFDKVVPKLLEHEALRSQLDKGDMTAVVRLKDAKAFVDLRVRRLNEAKKAYQKATADHVEYAGDPVHVTYHGDFDGSEALAGARGDRWLVHSREVAPLLGMTGSELEYDRLLETIGWRDAAGTRDVLWRGYHVQGDVAAAGKGNHYVLVEDLFGLAKAIDVIHGQGPAARLRVDAKAEFDRVALSTDGAAVAFTARACRGCPMGFEVDSVADGKTLYARKPAPGELAEAPKDSYFGFDWIDDQQVAMAVTVKAPPAREEPSADDDGSGPNEDPLKPGGEELRVIDVSKRPAVERRILELEPEEVCTSPVASSDGKNIAMTCGGTIAWIDAATGDRTATTEVGIDLAWSPDGARIAFVRDGDIWILRVSDKTARALTKNPFAENRPMFSEDGRRLYFQSQQDDPNVPGRISSVIASVEVP